MSLERRLRQQRKQNLLRVCQPEVSTGSVEYKRQVECRNPTRLRSLATQMVYRMDEARDGTAIYQVGVEDDGCHSLLDYPAVNRSCLILEHLARTHLNAVVVDRTFYQDEILLPRQQRKLQHAAATISTSDDCNGDYCDVGVDDDAAAGDDDGYNGVLEQLNFDDDDFCVKAATAPFVFVEPAILGDAHGTLTPPDSRWNSRRKPGIFTRAQLRIQRIETHKLPEPPPLLVMLGENETLGENVDGRDRDRDDNKESLSLLQQRDMPSANTTSPSSRAGLSSPVSSGGRPRQSSSLSKTSSRNAINIGDTLSFRNVRVAVLGNFDAGKSTLIGTLTTSSLDDGRGKTRSFVMKHRHEIESGRTSTVSQHLMGFTANGNPVPGRDSVLSNKIKGMDEIAKQAYRVVTLMDLAGHEKFLKTTFHGLSSGFADYALVLVNSCGDPQMHTTTMDHLNLCISCNIPIMIVFTKIDLCSSDAMLQKSHDRVLEMLQAPQISKPHPFLVKTPEDVTRCVSKFVTSAGPNSDVVPMISISSVTGVGIDLLQKLFFSLPKRRRHSTKTKRKFEFLVEEVFHDVPDVGAVVGGFVNAGELSIAGGSGVRVYVGPASDGSFAKAKIKSAHIARIPTTKVTAGQFATLALELEEDDFDAACPSSSSALSRTLLRRGIVVLQDGPGVSTMQFDAEICVLNGQPKTVVRGPHQVFVHVLNVRQAAVARNIQLVHHPTTTLQHVCNPQPSNRQIGNSQNTHTSLPVKSALSTVFSKGENENVENDDNDKENHDGDDDDDVVVLEPGSRAKVRLEFAQRPEYVRPGMRLLFRDGHHLRGVGLITFIPPPDSSPMQRNSDSEIEVC